MLWVTASGHERKSMYRTPVSKACLRGLHPHRRLIYERAHPSQPQTAISHPMPRRVPEQRLLLLLRGALAGGGVPQVLQEAEHDVRLAGAGPEARLAGLQGHRVVLQQLHQHPPALPAIIGEVSDQIVSSRKFPCMGTHSLSSQG